MKQSRIRLVGSAAAAFVVGGVCVAQCPQQKLTASDAEYADIFGTALDISGDRAIIGSIGDDDLGNKSGAAYIFGRAESAWSEQVKLLEDGGGPEHRFGRSVSLHGDIALVGSYSGDGPGATGAVYVYRFDGATWLVEQKLEASSGSPDDRYGAVAAVHGPVAVVGAYEDDELAEDAGAVYVYRFNGVEWIEEAKLTAADGVAFAWFGISVAVTDDHILVGAMRDSELATWSGAAYVFRYDGAAWTQEAKLFASDGALDEQFGVSVGLSGDVAVIGKRRDDATVNAGLGYAFRYDGSSWVEEAVLAPSDGFASDNFGRAVAVDGDVVVVGADWDDDNGPFSGSAYVFRYDGTTWAEVDKLLAADGATEDALGAPVALDGETALIGASLEDGVADFTGAAYVFQLDAACPDLDGDCVVGITDFLALLAAWGPNPLQSADLDGDGIVGILDFKSLLAAWGPCPE